MITFSLDIEALASEMTPEGREHLETVLRSFLDNFENDLDQLGDIRHGRLGWFREQLSILWRDHGLDKCYPALRAPLARELSKVIRTAFDARNLENGRARTTQIEDVLLYFRG